MPGPWTAQDEIHSYVLGLQRSGQEQSFLNPYREFLLKLEALGTISSSHSGKAEAFTFYAEAAEIRLDFLKHKDNFKSDSRTMQQNCGKGVMDHLGGLADAAGGPLAGPKRERTLRILREVITELRYPCTTTQGAHGTCVAETISTQLLLFNPAEWTRLAVGLLQGSPKSEVPTCLSGKPLRLPEDIGSADISPDRSLVAAYMQAAIKHTFAPPGWSYFNENDKYKDEKGKVQQSGMRIAEQVVARHALLGEEQVVKVTSKDWIKNPPEIGLYTVLTWSKNRKGQHATHAVAVTMYDAKNDLVIFRNPHRQQEWKKDNDILDDGPIRTSYNPELGLECMPLSAFMERTPYSILSRSELAAYEPPLAEVKAPAVERWPKLKAFGVGVALTAAAAGVGGSGFLGYRAYQSLSKDTPLDPIASASAMDRIDMFLNEQNVFGPRQWKAAFGMEVGSEPYPASLTNELALYESPLSKTEIPVFQSHRLILMPENVDFNQLERIAKKLGVSFEVGLSLQGGSINEISARGSDSSAPFWALLPRPEKVDSIVQGSFKGLSDFSKRRKLSQDFPNYRVATVAETILSTLLDVQEGPHVKDFQVMCVGDFQGSPLCVGYQAETKTLKIGTSSDFSFQELSVSMAYKLK